MRALTFSADIAVPFRIVPILLCRKVYPLSGGVYNLRGTEAVRGKEAVPSHLFQGFCAEGWSPSHCSGGGGGSVCGCSPGP